MTDMKQYKSTTSGHTGQLGEISKQEIESAFFGDEKNVKDKSLEYVPLHCFDGRD